MLTKPGFKFVWALLWLCAFAGLGGGTPVFAAEFVVHSQAAASAYTNKGLPPVGQKILWADFIGAPTIPANTLGLWVWSEDTSGQEILHVRTGSDGTAKTFSGTLRTNRVGNFYDLALVNASGDDSAALVKFNELTFSIPTSGGGEGFDVSWSGTWLFLDLYVNGAYVPEKIFVGAAAKGTTGAPLGVRAGSEGLLTLPLTMLDGATTFSKNIADGYFLYRDAKGRYHLRVTTTSVNDFVVYRGRIVAAADRFRIVREFRGDPRDFTRLSKRGKVLEFKYHTKGYVDGLDWILGNKNKPDNLVITLRMNDGVAAPNVALGSAPFGTLQAFTFRLVE